MNRKTFLTVVGTVVVASQTMRTRLLERVGVIPVPKIFYITKLTPQSWILCSAPGNQICKGCGKRYDEHVSNSSFKYLCDIPNCYESKQDAVNGWSDMIEDVVVELGV
jgi:hypothetical protein